MADSTFTTEDTAAEYPNTPKAFREIMNTSGIGNAISNQTPGIQEPIQNNTNQADMHFAIPRQNAEGKANNPGESDKLLAVSKLLVELREIAPKDSQSVRGQFNPRNEERFWHLLGFAEGVVEAMIREADAPESFGSWTFYTECRLKHFRSVFVPSSAQQP